MFVGDVVCRVRSCLISIVKCLIMIPHYVMVTQLHMCKPLCHYLYITVDEGNDEARLESQKPRQQG